MEDLQLKAPFFKLLSLASVSLNCSYLQLQMISPKDSSLTYLYFSYSICSVTHVLCCLQVSTMVKRADECESLQVKWLLDFTRGSRGDYNSCSMLQPLITRHPSSCSVRL